MLVPVGSKMDPLLAKAEPPSVAGGAFVIRYLRKGKKCCTVAVREEGEKCGRNNPAEVPGSVKKEGRRYSRQWDRYSPVAHGEIYDEAGCPAAAHGEDHSEEGISLQPMQGPVMEQVDMP